MGRKCFAGMVFAWHEGIELQCVLMGHLQVWIDDVCVFISGAEADPGVRVRVSVNITDLEAKQDLTIVFNSLNCHLQASSSFRFACDSREKTVKSP